MAARLREQKSGGDRNIDRRMIRPLGGECGEKKGGGECPSLGAMHRPCARRGAGRGRAYTGRSLGTSFTDRTQI